MRMIICGMGEVGRHLAAELTNTGYDVVAIDRAASTLADIESSLDVLTLRGHAGLPETLIKAGVDRAELLAAVTDHDEVNLVAALAARQHGARFTAARLNNAAYFPDPIGWTEGLLGVDLCLCPGLLAGAEVVRLTRASTVDWVENFAGHLVQAMVITVDEGVPAAGRTASQIALPERCRVLAVIRDGSTQTAESVAHLQPEDKVIISGPAQTLHRVDKEFRQEGRRRGRALVIGGGALGVSVATELLKIMDTVALIEKSSERCERLAETLDDRIDLQHGVGTAIQFLEELDVRHARAFVATTGYDEVNLMGTLLSKQLGARQAIALLHRADYADVYSALGIDSTVSPRLLVSKEIIRFLHRRREALVGRIPIDGSLVFERQIDDESPLVGKRLFDLDLPHGVVTVAVTRGRQILDDPELVELQPGDVFVVYSPERTITGVRRTLLRR